MFRYIPVMEVEIYKILLYPGYLLEQCVETW